MTSTKNIFKLRFINTLLFIVLLFIQYNGVFTLKIATANPMLPISLFVVICMFCSELSSVISGMIIGVFMDSVVATPAGFNAIFLMILGISIALIVRHLFNNNIMSAIALCLMSATAYFLLRWLFCFAFSVSFSETLTYLMQTAFPSVLYTTVFTVPFYYLERFLYKKFYS
ncbi:MAG: hypothetical protein Q4B40_01850 [Clostridia bacterium]|nr:hypothetical protein [Clostridia bacterium]